MIYLIFLLSGFTALIYQVAWMKMLSIEFGATVYAATTVLCVFMMGLALGSWRFGRRADHTPSPLKLYAKLEGALGAYALAYLVLVSVVHHVYQVIEHTFHPSYTSFSLIKFVFAFGLLLLPTTLMGGTLPVLCKHLGGGERGRGRRLGLLYSFNTFGAMLGSIAVSFFLILALGVRGSIALAAAINLLLAATAWWLAKRKPSHPQSSEATSDEDVTTVAGPRFQVSTPIVVAFVSGFVILASEVLWTRLFINFLTGNVLIFATVVTAVLAGLTTGGFIASLLVDRIKHVSVLLVGALHLGALSLVLFVVGQTTIAS